MNHPNPLPQDPVLVVDDDPMLRSMAVRTLRHAGFAASAAEDGEQGLAMLSERPHALVLLDVMMPGLDGYETCRRLRALPGGERVPVLMLTGLNDNVAIEQAYGAGATDFIVKPINWTLLAQRVRYALRAAAAGEAAIRNGERLARAQRIAALGHWELGREGRLVCSATLAELLGVPHPAGPVEAHAWLAHVHPDDRDDVAAARALAVSTGRGYQRTYRIQRGDGAERTVFEHAVPMCDASGRPAGLEGITQDISERVEAERRLQHVARHDLVTGLPNRLYFGEQAAPLLELAARQRTTCALLHLDLDRFKAVNDAFGLSEGDAVLRRIGERLQDSIRGSDLAGHLGGRPHDSAPTLARIGGNAYSVLLVDVGGERQAAQVAARLMRAVAMPLVIDGREVVLTSSVGIAMYPRDAAEPKALARCAEQAAFECKANGRAQLRFFDEAMNAEAGLRLTRETELRRAIGGGELRLYYQPKVDAETRGIVGAEALVRWQHPEHGLLPPGSFIPLAEESGLILPLTEWVLETACADLRRRREQGLPLVPVAVNLSSPSFADDALPSQLDAVTRRHGVAPSSLTLEVTETLLMRNPAEAARRLGELRERGFRLSLDDFGTGHSSLSYLQTFAVDELKIDRSFVADLTGGARRGAIARAVIALAREFDLEVVAEGVETVAQAACLAGQGCRLQQGFLYARPVPGDAFDRLLAQGSVNLPTDDATPPGRA